MSLTFLYDFTDADLDNGTYSIKIGQYPAIQGVFSAFANITEMQDKDFTNVINNLTRYKNNYYALTINPDKTVTPLNYYGEYQIQSETGELVTKSPRVGYLENPERARRLGPIYATP